MAPGKLLTEIPPPPSDGVQTGHANLPPKAIIVDSEEDIASFFAKAEGKLKDAYLRHPDTIPGLDLAPGDNGKVRFSTNARLSRMPYGYVLIKIPRETSMKQKTSDRYILGHPSGAKFRSLVEFSHHLEWLISQPRPYQNCFCPLCKKIPPSSKAVLRRIDGTLDPLGEPQKTPTIFGSGADSGDHRAANLNGGGQTAISISLDTAGDASDTVATSNRQRRNVVDSKRPHPAIFSSDEETLSHDALSEAPEDVTPNSPEGTARFFVDIPSISGDIAEILEGYTGKENSFTGSSKRKMGPKSVVQPKKKLKNAAFDLPYVTSQSVSVSEESDDSVQVARPNRARDTKKPPGPKSDLSFRQTSTRGARTGKERSKRYHDGASIVPNPKQHTYTPPPGWIHPTHLREEMTRAQPSSSKDGNQSSHRARVSQNRKQIPSVQNKSHSLPSASLNRAEGVHRTHPQSRDSSRLPSQYEPDRGHAFSGKSGSAASLINYESTAPTQLPTPLHRVGEIVWIMVDVRDPCDLPKEVICERRSTATKADVRHSPLSPDEITADIVDFMENLENDVASKPECPAAELPTRGRHSSVTAQRILLDLQISQQSGWVPWPSVVTDVFRGLPFRRRIVTSGHVSIYACSASGEIKLCALDEDVDELVAGAQNAGKRARIYPVAYACKLLGISDSVNASITMPEFHVHPFTSYAFPDSLCPLIEDMRYQLLQTSNSSGKTKSDNSSLWKDPAFVSYARSLAAARRYSASTIRVGGSHNIVEAETAESRTFSYWSHKTLHWGAEIIHIGDIVRIRRSAGAPLIRSSPPHPITFDDIFGLLPEDEELLEVAAIEWDPKQATGPHTEPRLFIIGRPCTAVDVEFYPDRWNPLWTKILRAATGQAILFGAKYTPLVSRVENGSDLDPQCEELLVDAEDGSSQPTLFERIPAQRLLGKFYGMQWARSMMQRAFLPPLPGILFSNLELDEPDRPSAESGSQSRGGGKKGKDREHEGFDFETGGGGSGSGGVGEGVSGSGAMEDGWASARTILTGRLDRSDVLSPEEDLERFWPLNWLEL
ncbi:hypothetical protein DFJ73DRAFT_843417 [Zopfochytrium polystomum]|nr:hypothetical protein DFJ73DRAFT_843417 [Zopfochytrium polystomum]